MVPAARPPLLATSSQTIVRKILFLILFVPAHSALTLVALQPLFNPPPPGLAATAWHVARVVLTSPLVLPLMMLDPDGERFPRWLQWLSLPLNSLVWGLAILAACAAIRWVCVQLAARDDRADG